MSHTPVWRPFLVILVLWTLAILWIAPWGNYPLNDDWTYARQVLTFLESGKLVPSNWAAMPFLPQSIFGIVLSKLFGFSFLTLRIGTLLIAVCSSFLLYRLLQRFSPMLTALALTLLFTFNPIYLYLATTYMTEVYYLFLLLVALSLMERHLRQPSWWMIAWITLATVGAALQRQTGLILPFSFALLYLMRKEASGREKIRSMIPAFCSLLALILYSAWRAQGEATHSHYAHFTDIFASLFDFRFTFFLERGGMILLYLGLFTAPLLILLPWKNRLRSSLAWSVLGCIAVLIAYAFHNFPRNQVLFNLGIGPRLLKDTMAHQFPFFPQIAYTIASAFSAVSILLLAYSVLASISQRLKEGLATLRHIDPWKLLLGLALSGYTLYLLLNLIFFDRYLLPLLLLLVLAMAPFLQKLRRKAMYAAVLALLFVANCILLRDHFLWQTTRWEAIAYAEAQGVTPDRMDAGFEYNCWHNGEPSQSHSDDMHQKGWWSVVKDDYILSEDTLPHYTPLAYFAYDPILGEKDALVLSIRTSLFQKVP